MYKITFLFFAPNPLKRYILEPLEKVPRVVSFLIEIDIVAIANLTSYSSLFWMQKLPLDFLFCDKNFVRDEINPSK